MCIVGKSELLKLIDKYKAIHPFDLELLDGDGYVLTVGEKRTLQYLEHKNLVSHEVVFTPPHYVAQLTAKSRYGRMGLSFLNAAKVHSGFIGRLVIELVNLANDRTPITIRRGDPLMHIEFVTREGEPCVYTGSYMFQYMSEGEVELYKNIILTNFPKEFDKKTVEEQAKNKIVE